MSLQIPRRTYADLYGPTTGDRIRLADTELIIEIEKDFTRYGDEITFGGGKVIRDGMGQSSPAMRESENGALDLVITNAVILDHWGIVKGDIGVKNGRIVKVGKAGNPDTMEGVDPELVVGAATEVIAGENLIVTAGGIDSHIHFISPQQVYEAISNGITTMIGGGTGPATGTAATTCTPGAWNLARMLQAAEAWPMNFGFLGKGNASTRDASCRADRGRRLRAEAARGLGNNAGRNRRLPEGCGRISMSRSRSTPTRSTKRVSVEATIAAIDGRAIHTYHTEGAGGGHAPDIIRIASIPERSAVVHQSHASLHRQHHRRASRHADGVPSPESAGAGRRRLRGKPHPAGDHRRRGYPARLGVLSMISSDSQAMGRIGEVVTRTWQTAHKMKMQRGPLPEDSAAQRQSSRQALCGEVHDQSGDHAWHGCARSARSSPASWRIWCCGNRHFSG